VAVLVAVVIQVGLAELVVLVAVLELLQMFLVVAVAVLVQQWYLGLVVKPIVVEPLMVVALAEETQFRVQPKVTQLLVEALACLVLAAAVLVVTVRKEQVVQVVAQLRQEKMLLELLLVLTLVVVVQEQINQVGQADHLVVVLVVLAMLV
jgi:hypothetical protein